MAWTGITVKLQNR